MRWFFVRSTVVTGSVMIFPAFACGGSSDAPADSQAEPTPPNQTAAGDDAVSEGAPESTAFSAAIGDNRCAALLAWSLH